MKTFTRIEIALSVILGLFMLFLAVRGFLDPAEAARGFGIAVVHPGDLFYLRVKADRDLSSVAAIFALLAFRERRALGIFLGVAMLQPLFDLVLSVSDPRGHLFYALGIHGGTVVYGVILVALLLRRAPRTA